MATVIFPLGTIAGSITSYGDVDLPIAAPGVDGTVTRVFLRHSDYQSSPSGFAGGIYTQAGGAGTPLAFTMPDVTQSVEVAGALALDSLETLYLRLTAPVNFSMNLSGWVELEVAAPVVGGPYLTTVARVKSYLGIQDVSKDQILLEIIPGVSAAMQRWMDRLIIESTNSDEWLDSIGTATVQTKDYPVVSISELEAVGSPLVEDTDYEREEATGILTRISANGVLGWPAQRRAVKVSYTHGWSTLPEDLVLAATRESAREFEKSQPGSGRLGFQGTILPQGGTSTYAADDFLPSTIQAMAPYRRAA